MYLRTAFFMALLSMAQGQEITLVVVASGSLTESVTIEHEGPKPDFDRDGMPDDWESSHGLNPRSDDTLADSDNDGQSNYQEYIDNTDPQDFFNGEIPVLTLVSGDRQVAQSGDIPQPILVKVARQDGTAWRNAPVMLEVVYGEGHWIRPLDGGLRDRILLTARSDGTVEAKYRVTSFDALAITKEIGRAKAGRLENQAEIQFVINDAVSRINPHENGLVEGMARILSVHEHMPGFSNLYANASGTGQLGHFNKVRYTRRRLSDSSEYLSRVIESTFDISKESQTYLITKTIENVASGGVNHGSWADYWGSVYRSIYWWNGGQEAWLGQRWVNGRYYPAGWIAAWWLTWSESPNLTWDLNDYRTWDWTSPMGVNFLRREMERFFATPSNRQINTVTKLSGAWIEDISGRKEKDDYAIEFIDALSAADLEENFARSRSVAGDIESVPWGEEWIFGRSGYRKRVSHWLSIDDVYLTNDPTGDLYGELQRRWGRAQVKFVLTGNYGASAWTESLVRWYEAAYDPVTWEPVITIHQTLIPRGEISSPSLDIRYQEGDVIAGMLPFFATNIAPHNLVALGGTGNTPASVLAEGPEFEDRSTEAEDQEAYFYGNVLKGAASLQQIYLSVWNDWLVKDQASVRCVLLPESTANVRLWAWNDGAWQLLPYGQDLTSLLPDDTSMIFAEAITPGKAILRFSITIQGQVISDDIVIFAVPPEPGLYVDSNRDGEIKIKYEPNADETNELRPFRLWPNDDDDQGPADGDDIPGRPLNKADYNNAVVDSVRDLVDFFPVFLDIKQLLDVLPHTTAGVTYKLKQVDGALNLVYTNKTRAQAFDYQKQILATGFGPSFTQAAGEATTERITAAGVTLNIAFLDRIKNNDGGVILIEGRVATTAPLRLVVEKNGTEIAEVAVNIRISPVEEMFRHVNLTAAPKNYDGTAPGLPETPEASRTGEPTSYPDSLTNGKYFVFLHGYNVDAQKARGWDAEVFKRMHVLGAKTRFVGVTWHGATGLDYHRAVFHAFQTGDALAGALSFTGNADVTIAGHSLGNMVVSHAIQAGGLSPARYYIINGATPLEAYAVNDAGPGEAANMTELAWRTYDSRLYMSNWDRLFPNSDNRNALTWKNLFASVRTRAVTHNFYSAEEDVVADADQNTSASIMATLLNQGFNVSLGAWKAQELVKGVDWTTSIVSAFMIRGQAGWGFNLDGWYTMTNPPGPPGQGGVGVKHRLTPSEAAVLVAPDRIDELKTKPFFGRFLELGLLSADGTTASTKAGEAWVRYDLLARGIPAMSNATAANVMPSLTAERNFPMHTAGKVAANGPFPTNARGDWRHSDFKDVGLPYVYPMYQAMIDQGGLNQ